MAEQVVALRNSGWRRVRIALILAGVFAALAGAAGIIVGGKPAAFQQTGAGTVATLVIIFGGIFAATLLLIAAILGFTASKADQLYEQFGRGEVIADWAFPAEEWEAFLVKRHPRNVAKRWTAAIGCVAPLGIIGLFAVNIGGGPGTRVVWYLAIVACSVALCWTAFHLIDNFAQRRVARLRQRPRVLIGRGGIECGGELTQWNTVGVALVEVCLADGNPLMLKVVTGNGKSVQTLNSAMAAVEVLSLVMGGDSIASGGSTKIRTELFIPIPASDPAEGARIVAALLTPA